MTTTSLPLDERRPSPRRRVWSWSSCCRRRGGRRRLVALAQKAVVATGGSAERAGGARGARCRQPSGDGGGGGGRPAGRPHLSRGPGHRHRVQDGDRAHAGRGPASDAWPFAKGKRSRAGTLLAQVDPRPFTIQLHTAQAALARDEAQLRGGAPNLERYQGGAQRSSSRSSRSTTSRRSVEQLRGQVRADQAQVESARLQLTYARITVAHRRRDRRAAGRPGQRRARQRPGRHRHRHPAGSRSR